MVNTCPSENARDKDQSSFWSGSNVNWDPHRIGWVVAGSFTVLTILISIFSISMHAANYTNRREQRQIMRILYMPPVYAVISFLSYRFFRAYTYYELVEVIYEALCLSCFLFLIMEYVAKDAPSGKQRDRALQKVFERKAESDSYLPIPLCCCLYRPEKISFVPAVKFTVLQYAIFRPLISIVAIICEACHVLCETEGIFKFQYAYFYLTVFDFISISVALYGLILFYSAVKDDDTLKGRRPLQKFFCIKLIVMFTFYQSLLFSFLEGRAIHATEYWTETNIADGLDALVTCIEMSIFAFWMVFAYGSTEYKKRKHDNGGKVDGGFFKALWESVYFWDFLKEFGRCTRDLGLIVVGIDPLKRADDKQGGKAEKKKGRVGRKKRRDSGEGDLSQSREVESERRTRKRSANGSDSLYSRRSDLS